MKKHSTIRALEQKAYKNDINALYQLAKYYEQGEFVSKDTEKAMHYFAEALELFQSQCLQISSVKLVDFRIFNTLDIDFCYQLRDRSNLTVIIGDNGAGKTTILESLSKSLSWLILGIRAQGGKGEVINQLDINNDNSVGYASIISNFLIAENAHYKIELSKTKDAAVRLRKNHLLEIKQLADIYKFSHSKNRQFNFPIMAFYSVERALDISKNDISPFNEVSESKDWSKFDGYDRNALNGKADFILFFRWFKYLDDLHNAIANENQNALVEINKLQAELSSELVIKMEKQATTDSDTNQFLLSFKQEKQEEINKLKATIVEDQASSILNSVTQAIYSFMPEFDNLRIGREPLAMLVDKDNITLDILQLSQGEKSLLALVADIARRLVLLNPSLEKPLLGNGIVLIDEIDLHLHPAWQQTVIPNLLNTFPNIQFIITTHSPQVLTTVHHECIRILTKEGVFNVSVSTFGEESRTTLEDVMGTDSRPQDLMSQQLTRYLELINRGEIESNEISTLRANLEKHYGNVNSQLRLADMAINRWLVIRNKKDTQNK